MAYSRYLGGYGTPEPYYSVQGGPQPYPRLIGPPPVPGKQYVAPGIPGGSPGPVPRNDAGSPVNTWNPPPKPFPGNGGGYSTPGPLPSPSGGGRPGLKLGGYSSGNLPGIAAGEPSLTGNRGGGASPLPPVPPPPLLERDQYGNYQQPAGFPGFSDTSKSAASLYAGGSGAGGPFQRMPGAFYSPTPGGGGWRSTGPKGEMGNTWQFTPSQRRVTGAANIAARMGMISQDRADQMTQQALSDLAASYADGSMDAQTKQWYEGYMGAIAENGYYDPSMHPTGQFINRGWDETPSSEEMFSYFFPDRPGAPQVSWGFGETPTPEQLAEAEKAYYAWLKSVFGDAPPPTPQDQY